ncbi:MAG: DUF2812 domain-containing protein [Clostridia bacterium]|nr:DUF2812 domain-containing protein [Clostridia bacterium]
MLKYRFMRTDVKKEEKWLEQQREKGYRLLSVNGLGRYYFEKCDSDFVPKTRIDVRSFKNKAEYENYLALFEDSGWKLIKGNKDSGWQYFQQMSDKSDGEIFSDDFAAVERNKRLSMYWFSYMVLYLPIFICIYISSQKDWVRWLSDPKTMFLTPGLWQMEGLTFWYSFLFEFPFVLFRLFPIIWLIINVTILIVSLVRYFICLKQANNMPADCVPSRNK